MIFLYRKFKLSKQKDNFSIEIQIFYYILSYLFPELVIRTKSIPLVQIPQTDHLRIRTGAHFTQAGFFLHLLNLFFPLRQQIIFQERTIAAFENWRSLFLLMTTLKRCQPIQLAFDITRTVEPFFVSRFNIIIAFFRHNGSNDFKGVRIFTRFVPLNSFHMNLVLLCAFELPGSALDSTFCTNDSFSQSIILKNYFFFFL
jgi:hypothetical protein